MAGQPAQQFEGIKHDAAARRLVGSGDIGQAERPQLMDGAVIATVGMHGDPIKDPGQVAGRDHRLQPALILTVWS